MSLIPGTQTTPDYQVRFQELRLILIRWSYMDQGMGIIPNREKAY